MKISSFTKRKVINIIYFLSNIIGFKKTTNILWNALGLIYTKNTSLGGEGEKVCWEQLRNKFNKPVIIDVGANTGFISNQFLEIFPDAKIYAIEPINEFFQKIDDSLLVAKFNLALSNKNKNINIYQSGQGAKSLPYKSKNKKKVTKHNVRSITGDSFIRELNLKKVDIIKIDTDGYDFEILLGFIETIRTNKPIIQIELSKWWLQMGYTAKQAESFFKDLNYSLFLMTNDGIKSFDINYPDTLFLTMNLLALPNDFYFNNKK